MLNTYTVAFFGHRQIEELLKVENLLEAEIRKLIDEKEFVEFIVGSNGNFDRCVSSTVLRTRKKHRDDNSALVLVLPYPTKEYLNNKELFHSYYTDVEISYNASRAYPKSAIQTRNREMVDKADLVICYIKEKHGGGWQSVKYAIKQGKNVINLAAETEGNDYKQYFVE